MKKINSLSLTAILIGLLTCTSHAQSNTESTIKVFGAEGFVQLVDIATGETTELTTGDEFTAGVTVVTVARSTAKLVFSNGDTLILNPGSTLEITSFTEAGGGEMQLSLKNGSFVAKLSDPQSGNNFRVTTPDGPVSIKNFEQPFRVAYSPTDGKLLEEQVRDERLELPIHRERTPKSDTDIIPISDS